jgi:hypothetical protein
MKPIVSAAGFFGRPRPNGTFGPTWQRPAKGTIWTMPVALQAELDAVRWKLDRLARRRLSHGLSDWESELYERLTAREAELLDLQASGR